MSLLPGTERALLHRVAVEQAEWRAAPLPPPPRRGRRGGGGGGGAPRGGRGSPYASAGCAPLGRGVAPLRGARGGGAVRGETLEPLEMTRTTIRPAAPHAEGLAVHPWADAVLPEPEHDSAAMAPAGQLW